MAKKTVKKCACGGKCKVSVMPKAAPKKSLADAMAGLSAQSRLENGIEDALAALLREATLPEIFVADQAPGNDIRVLRIHTRAAFDRVSAYLYARLQDKNTVIYPNEMDRMLKPFGSISSMRAALRTSDDQQLGLIFGDALEAFKQGCEAKEHFVIMFVNDDGVWGVANPFEDNH